MRSVVPRAQEMVRVDFEVPTLADAELYGSKLVAALDRQHPRDIFDVQHMYETHGLRDMPAIRWKIENLRKLKARDERRFAKQAALLAEALAALDQDAGVEKS